MKLYTCGNCRNQLYFENNICLNCRHLVGFDMPALSLITLESTKANTYHNITDNKINYRYCANAVYGTCNWLVPVNNNSEYCLACELNRIIPSLNNPENLKRWKSIEIAKHRLIYSLLRLCLPVIVKKDNEDEGIAFDFMADVSPEKRVITGHDKGTITLNIEEADEAQLVKHKLDLGERYRTLLGHFRHEIGHYYWDVLIQNSNYLQKFRQLFGDEQIDYAEALKIYYKNGAPANWSENFISPYATSHPWEDWAETWAHYLHMMDTLETAYNFGVDINPIKANHKEVPDDDISKDPYTVINFGNIIKMWLPLTFAVNSLNRSMGYADFYPFIISPTITEKLRFIHEVCGKARWGNL
jgi:hypothetical protein